MSLLIRPVLWFLLASVLQVAEAGQSTTGAISSSELVFSGRTFSAQHPATFTLEVLNTDLRKPRIIHFHGNRMLIGSRSGNIYRLDPPYTIASSLAKLDKYPHSVVVRDDYIYVARKNGIYRAAYDDNTDWIPENSFRLFVKLPGGKGHSSRTIKMGPDHQLYVSLGLSGNCSDQYLDASYSFNSRRGGIYLIDESGGTPVLTPFASGLRNAIGFDWHPQSGEMYASNNGPDHLGFDQPPEYFARLLPGSFHGMPWFQYNGESFAQDDCQDSTPPRPVTDVPVPAALFPAHNAPMDMVFVPRTANASEFTGDAIVALHGSWAAPLDGSGKVIPSKRRPPKLVLVRFRDGKPREVEDLVTGFQSVNSGSRWARPVGVAVGPDGDIYFTSDAGAQGLYRLRKIKAATND